MFRDMIAEKGLCEFLRLLFSDAILWSDALPSLKSMAQLSVDDERSVIYFNTPRNLNTRHE